MQIGNTSQTTASYPTEIDVNVQDQSTKPFFNYAMTAEKEDITTTADVAIGAKIIPVSSGHGFTIGSWMILRAIDQMIQCKVTNVSTNDITIDRPLPTSYPSGTRVIRGTIEMNVDGSVTPKIYYLKMYDAITPIDILELRLTMAHSAEADDSKFGSITALTNGLMMRKINHTVMGLGIYKANSDFKEYGATVVYTSKAGSGVYGTDIVIAVRSVYGVVIRLSPSNNDQLAITVQDNLSTLTKFRISIIGHYTVGEQ